MTASGFSFPLRPRPEKSAGGVNDLFGLHLRALLDFLIPAQNGREITVDGYRLLNGDKSVYPLSVDETNKPEFEPDPLNLYEPRIIYIRRLLESLLDHVELETAGKPAPVDGFRLKNLNDWLSPGGGADEIIAHAASRCNLNCRFCYNQGAPPTLKPLPKNPSMEYAEILERIHRYLPGARLNLFPNMGSPAECLAHPDILDILRRLRQKTGEAFRIPSNGATLTPSVIEALAGLKPLSVDVSLNSASPDRRKWLMRDNKPQIALDSLALLKQAGIPYTVVIVPWPFPSPEVMLADLRQTVFFADRHDPVLIQISLPGYSRAASPETAFDTEAVWPLLKNACLDLRSRVGAPVVLRPGLYEEYHDAARLNEPRLIGVVKNSPAHAAGLKPGDRLVKITGLPVKNRWQARSLLTTLHQSDLARAEISIERDGKMADLTLNPTRFDYPYLPETSVHLGLVFSSSGIPLKWFEQLRELISHHQAGQVLLLTSTLVRPYVEKFLFNGFLPDKVNIHLKVPRNDYFGGNILLGDLLVVSDFIQAIEEFIRETKIRPDLVIVPSSPFRLSEWGRDLTGTVYLEIERRTGIPVALAECDPIFD